jgi:hypothetical protein
MSSDTWGQQIASMNRRGRFIDAIVGWGLATADGVSDRSDDCSLGLQAGNGKGLLHSLATAAKAVEGITRTDTLAQEGLYIPTKPFSNIDSNPYG